MSSLSPCMHSQAAPHLHTTHVHKVEKHAAATAAIGFCLRNCPDLLLRAMQLLPSLLNAVPAASCLRPGVSPTLCQCLWDNTAAINKLQLLQWQLLLLLVVPYLPA